MLLRSERTRNLALSLGAGLVGGLLSNYAVPVLVHAQQPQSLVSRELRAQRFVLVNETNKVMATLIYQGMDPTNAVAALVDRGGQSTWTTPNRMTLSRGVSPSRTVFSIGNGTTAPTVLTRVEPEYSDQARNAKYSGSVLLSLVVNTDGKADDIKVLRGAGMGLDEKAIEAVQKWTFRPGKSNGVPMRVRAQIEVDFRLLGDRN
jgi:TonB family protein